jgi:hypothetical protein
MVHHGMLPSRYCRLLLRLLHLQGAHGMFQKHGGSLRHGHDNPTSHDGMTKERRDIFAALRGSPQRSIQRRSCGSTVRHVLDQL